MIVSTRLPLQGRAVPPQGLPPAPCPAARRCPPPSRQRRVAVHSFQFFKSLGLKKPAFLPDFGRRKREAVLQRFFGPIDRETYEELLAPDFTFAEVSQGGVACRYSRADWINMLCSYLGPAIPDFSWTPATDAKIADGFSVVEVQPCGHHTGTALALPPTHLTAVPPSGQRFSLPPEVLKVKVEQGKIKEIVALRGENSGPLALYNELAKHACMPERHG